jgi:hypothetical protein
MKSGETPHPKSPRQHVIETNKTKQAKSARR